MNSFKEHLYESINYQSTLEFIKKAHVGQKYGHEPYWKHPVAVAETGARFFGSKFGTAAKLAALLHDVVEDTPHTLDDLLGMGYPEEVVKAVGLLSKDKSMTYADNIQRIISSGNKTAMMVKYADNFMNYTGDKTAWDPEKRAASQSKYRKSIETIADKLGVQHGLAEERGTMNYRYAKSMSVLAEALDI